LAINQKEKETIAASHLNAARNENYRKKQYIIRITFPGGYVSCEKMVWKTLLEVERFAGAERVRGLGNVYCTKNTLFYAVRQIFCTKT